MNDVKHVIILNKGALPQNVNLQKFEKNMEQVVIIASVQDHIPAFILNFMKNNDVVVRLIPDVDGSINYKTNKRMATLSILGQIISDAINVEVFTDDMYIQKIVDEMTGTARKKQSLLNMILSKIRIRESSTEKIYKAFIDCFIWDDN